MFHLISTYNNFVVTVYSSPQIKINVYLLDTVSAYGEMVYFCTIICIAAILELV